MTVGAIESNNTIDALGLQSYAKQPAANTSQSNPISDVYVESDETRTFREIASEFDITNMSRNEANQMFQQLYDNDLISLLDLGLATFDPTGVPGWQDGISTVDGWAVSSDPDAKMNYLEGFKTQAEYNEKYGDPKFQDNYDRLVALAEKINFFQA